MAENPWQIPFSRGDHPPSETTRPAVETAVLHELIIQTVTERRVEAGEGKDYGEKLEDIIKRAQATDQYKQMATQANVPAAEVTALLDSMQLEKLPTHPSKDVSVMMITGGPATGKSSLIKEMEAAHPEAYRDAAKLHPDTLRPLLADPKIYGTHFSDVAQVESSQLGAEITARLDEKLKSGNGPNVVMEVVAPHEPRINLAKEAGHLVVYTGTVEPEQAVDRAYSRSLEEGRRLATEAVLTGARKVPEHIPDVFSHPDVEFKLFDTGVPRGSPPTLIAHSESNSSAIIVREPDKFIDYVERKNLNTSATSPEQLLPPEARTPQTIAQNMADYTVHGTTVALLDPAGNVSTTISSDGVTKVKPLESARGEQFARELESSLQEKLPMRAANEETRQIPTEQQQQQRQPSPDGERGAAQKAQQHAARPKDSKSAAMDTSPAPAAAPASPAPATPPTVETKPKAPAEVPAPAKTQPTVTSNAKAADAKMGRAVAIAGAVTGASHAVQDAKDGNYGKAAVEAGGATLATTTAIAQSEVGREAAEAAASRLGLKAGRAIGEKIPLVGGVVAAGFAVYEIGGATIDAVKGEGSWAKVGTTTAANIVEVGGGLVGFGLGEAGRQGVVEGSKYMLGDKNAPTDSATVAIGKEIYHSDMVKNIGKNLSSSGVTPAVYDTMTGLEIMPASSPEPEKSPVITGGQNVSTATPPSALPAKPAAEINPQARH